MPPGDWAESASEASRGHDGKNCVELTAERAALCALNHARSALTWIVLLPTTA